MPFDTATKPDTETAVLLRKARKLIDKSFWQCGGPAHGSFCIILALDRAATGSLAGWTEEDLRANKAFRIISRLVGGDPDKETKTVADFNDTHSKAEVLALLDRAIELAREEG